MSNIKKTPVSKRTKHKKDLARLQSLLLHASECLNKERITCSSYAIGPNVFGPILSKKYVRRQNI